MSPSSSPSAASSVFDASLHTPSSPSTLVSADSPNAKAAPDRTVEAPDTSSNMATKTSKPSQPKRRGAPKKVKKQASKAEREAMAAELDALLRKSAAFSQILTKKTEVLGRVGCSLDGKTLGEHDLKMAEQPECMVGGTMRDYQREGLTWLYEICLQGMSGILADEMGLGKTVQTIALIALLREQENYLGPHLIIGPLSTLSNWMDEFHKWVPSVPVVLYLGDPATRKQVRENMIFPHLEGGRPSAKFPVVVTSYDYILRDREHLTKINWEFIIIDEGHRMKNFESKLFTELQKFSSATRLLITGTPLQNNLQELWSLLHFLLPSLFGSWDAFESWFDFSDLQDDQGTQKFIGDHKKQDTVKKIHAVLQPLLLRRIKADVAAYLPKKREYVLYAPMTKEQTELYNVFQDSSVDARAFLQQKAVERLTKDQAGTRPPKRKSFSAKTKAATSESPAPATVLSIRQSPRKATSTMPPKQSPKDAFAVMMGKRGRGRPPKNAASSVPSPAASATPSRTASLAPPAVNGSKRKASPTSESSVSKSARSSRHSTPAASRRGKGRKVKLLKDDESDDDELDDDEFEAKLLRIADRAKDSDDESDEPEEDERAKTLELAKREISQKKLGNPLMQLRLVCNSPHNLYNPWASDNSHPVDESIVTASGKMLLLDRLLPELFARGHKVLIFSQFKTQLDILEDYCSELRGWNTCRIDGSVPQESRRDQIREFNANEDFKIFLLSTRSGGQGINLASADTVILFDSDWNPQMDLQAQDRAHRIGQTKPVVVYRLATKGTVEEELLMSADAKRRLEKLVIKKGGFKNMHQKADPTGGLDKEALKALLLKDGQVYEYSGSHEILSDADIDILLDRSDAAYERARKGDGNADGYTVVETKVEGITAAQG